MQQDLYDVLYRWSRDLDAPVDFNDLGSHLSFLEQWLFHEYEPALSHDHPRFKVRLFEWINSALTEEQMKLLFEFCSYLYFVGTKEFDVLYQYAYTGPTRWWVAESMEESLGDDSYPDAYERLLSETWFCPITDSMQIARFHHINGIKGRDLRPDWRTLSYLGHEDTIREHMARNGLTRVVLLEDFVGTGNQAREALEFAATFDDIPILCCPLLICPDGADELATFVAETRNLTFDPIVVLGPDAILRQEPQNGEPQRFAAFRSLIQDLGAVVFGSDPTYPETNFGYKGTGALSILFSNCPNNVPTLVHHDESPTWRPLFPRSSRR